ncbi:hypothetical protein Tco_1414974 [Tanacetum coccineum]
METIHVKFDELTSMAFKHDCLEPETNRFNVDDSSAESIQTPSKVDLDDLFDIPSSSPIILKDNKAPPLVSSSEEQTSPISNDVANEYIQADFADLDRNTLTTSFCPPVTEEAKSSSTNQDPSNMHEFNQVHPSTHTWTKAHPL